MGVSATLLELIDLRTFSTLWFWIALASAWALATHWVIGVPYDMVLSAQRHGHDSAPARELGTLVRIRARRMTATSEAGTLVATALASFVVTALGLSGFLYGVEIAQALFLMAAPMLVIRALGLRLARQIAAGDPDDEILTEPLCRRMRHLRAANVTIALVAIFVTTMWGMYVNITHGIFGG